MDLKQEKSTVVQIEMNYRKIKRYFHYLITLLLFINSYKIYSDDFQSWNIISLSGQLTEQLSLRFENQFRVGNYWQNLNYVHLDLTAEYQPSTKWILIGFSYREIFARYNNSIFKEERMPVLFFTLKYTKNKFSIENRNRFEYKYYTYQDDTWYYRNKTKIKYKIPYGNNDSFALPYISNELFVDIKQTRMLQENRFILGIDFVFSNKYTLGSFYEVRTYTFSNSNHIINDHILGFVFDILFPFNKS